MYVVAPNYHLTQLKKKVRASKNIRLYLKYSGQKLVIKTIKMRILVREHQGIRKCTFYICW